jgi:hypothetical protein
VPVGRGEGLCGRVDEWVCWGEGSEWGFETLAEVRKDSIRESQFYLDDANSG